MLDEYIDFVGSMFTHIYDSYLPESGVDKQPALDTNLIYKPTWSCAWNKINNQGKECFIVAHDERLALVVFEGNIEYLVGNIYRIEDIGVTNE